MSEFRVVYNRDEGTLRVKADLEADLSPISSIQDLAMVLRDLSRGSIGVMEGLVRQFSSGLRKIPEEAMEEVEVPELTSIEGLGPSRIEDLRRIGIESVADLAGADPSDILGEIRGVGLTREVIRGWIEEAKELTSRL